VKPTELRLLAGIRQLVQQLAGQLADPRQIEYLQLMEVVLGELIRRQDRAFYVQMHERAAALLSEGHDEPGVRVHYRLPPVRSLVSAQSALR
jgi:hypothetical protein